jgi:Family of unknown function (DUF5683)
MKHSLRSMIGFRIPLLLLPVLCSLFCIAQNNQPDTLRKNAAPIVAKTFINKYDSATKAHSPRVAAIRSAIFPGLGQIYNKKYWKLPIVYGALGTCAGIFIFNLDNYKNTRFAYRVKYNMRVNRTDSALFKDIKKELQPLSEESLRFYRNQYRRDIDYSALVFILLWGLNVVDATVDAHLKSFDVSPDLSLRFKAGYSEIAKTNGLSIVLKIGK